MSPSICQIRVYKMYNIVRIIIGCSIFAILKKLTKKCKQSIKNKISIGISILLYVVIVFIPFENLFITFDSPVKAYDYYDFGKSNVVLLVDGENCDLIVDDDEGTLRSFIVPKTKDGWKIGTSLNNIKKEQKFNYDNFLFTEVIQYKNTSDYFIIIGNGEELNISDNHNSKFYFIDQKNDILDENPYRIYYAHVSDFDSQYRVIINGVELTLAEIQDF